MPNPLASSSLLPLDRPQPPPAGPLLLATTDAELRRVIEQELASLGCQVVAVGSASELLARLAQPGRVAPAGILLDDDLAAGAPKARAALLSAIEAVAGSLAHVVPLVSPSAGAWSGAAGEGREVVKPVNRGALRLVLARLARLAPIAGLSVPAAAPSSSRQGVARWLRPKLGAAHFAGEEWLYPALLGRFRERCSDVAPRFAALFASGDYRALERLLGQVATGARQLGAEPLANSAAALSEVLRQGLWSELAGRLQDLQEALVATFAAAGRHLSGCADDEPADDPLDATQGLAQRSVA